MQFNAFFIHTASVRFSDNDHSEDDDSGSVICRRLQGAVIAPWSFKFAQWMITVMTIMGFAFMFKDDDYDDIGLMMVLVRACKCVT